MAVRTVILCRAVCVCDMNKAGMCSTSANFVMNQPLLLICTERTNMGVHQVAQIGSN